MELWGELWGELLGTFGRERAVGGAVGENSKSKRELGWKFCLCAVDQKKAVSYQGWHVSGPLALWGGSCRCPFGSCGAVVGETVGVRVLFVGSSLAFYMAELWETFGRGSSGAVGETQNPNKNWAGIFACVP